MIRRVPICLGGIRIPSSFVFLEAGWPVTGAVVTHDGKLLFDLSVDWSAGLQDPGRHPLFRRKKLARAERLLGTSTVLTTSESAGFFHWMTDAFPGSRFFNGLVRCLGKGWIIS